TKDHADQGSRRPRITPTKDHADQFLPTYHPQLSSTPACSNLPIPSSEWIGQPSGLASPADWPAQRIGQPSGLAL
ncbi:MAG: hypothetical protein OSA98_13840, partial [Rubripirellula sp.]|nr:hypothetical protein [Rubripirellula sp.]